MHIFLGVLINLLLQTFTINSKADDIVGVWLTEKKESKIEIYKKGNKYFGKIIWIKETVGPDGKEKLDVNNPDANKRDRPLLGLTLLKNLTWDADEQEWNEGEIYDPKSGNTYSMLAKKQGQKQLYLKGYIGVSLLGRSTIWTRVE